MKVYKFGGTSMGDARAISQVIDIIVAELSCHSDRLIVVCSAMGGVTDLLIDMSQSASKDQDAYIGAYHRFRDQHTAACRALVGDGSQLELDLDDNHEILKSLLRGIQLVREVSPRTMDYVLSFGERNSSYVLSQALTARGVNAEYLDARKIIVTNKEFTNAKVDLKRSYTRIKEYISQSAADVLVVTGFIGADKGGLTTTIGRGGSDYTASIIAAGVDAEQLEIWTDVDGVLTSDPRKVSKAFTIAELSYGEAMEMAHFGAKVIYPPTVLPAMKADIPILIRNTFNPAFKGTRISRAVDSVASSNSIKGVTALSKIGIVSVQGSGMMGVPGISARLFSALAANDINVILITQASSEYNITFAVAREDVAGAKRTIEDVFAPEVQSGKIACEIAKEQQSIIAVIGEQMRAMPGIAGRLFGTLGRNGININAIAQGSSELNISLVIDQYHEAKALSVIHDSFFEEVARPYHLYICGVGLIGSTLMQQIEHQHSTLVHDHGIDLRIVMVANSKVLVNNKDGITASGYREMLTSSNEANTVETILSVIDSDNLPNSILVDNTAGSTIPSIYGDLLDRNVSVVTPNKVASSGDYDYYRSLVGSARRKNIDFLYETNVGAGLPIIKTIRSMVESGDVITEISAVLSGSLSFIFNNYDGSKPFSSLVRQAQEEGYTEPDPRDDLSMQDVQRKITILAREAGHAVSMRDVNVKEMLPANIMNAGSVEAFFVELERNDLAMQQRIQEVVSVGKRLRVVASWTAVSAEIALVAVDNESPFYTLSGSDNMVVLTSERYRDTPLVVKGPGAGAEVTAAGVFSDILSIAKRR